MNKEDDELKKVKMMKQDLRIDEFLKRHKSVFRFDFPDDMPPGRVVEHVIDINGRGKLPHRSLYQLSPAELKAAKKYVERSPEEGEYLKEQIAVRCTAIFHE